MAPRTSRIAPVYPSRGHAGRLRRNPEAGTSFSPNRGSRTPAIRRNRHSKPHIGYPIPSINTRPIGLLYCREYGMLANLSLTDPLTRGTRAGGARKEAKTMSTVARASHGIQGAALVHYYSRRVVRRWREATAQGRLLPQFIVAGAPKCGTTALYFYLLSHPQVMPPSKNEIGFFSEGYYHGLDWYRSYFPFRVTASWKASRVNRSIVTGEHTPFYLMHPLAAERIASTLPDVRLIILLRDPVVRAYSHYQHEFRCGHEHLSFRDAITMEPQRTANEIDRMRSDLGYRSPEYVRHAYVDQGEYRAKLEQLFRRVARSRVLILHSEGLSAQTQATFDRVTDFLHLDRLKLNNIRRVNAGSYEPLKSADPETNARLREHFKSHNESLYAYLGIDFGW